MDLLKRGVDANLGLNYERLANAQPPRTAAGRYHGDDGWSVNRNLTHEEADRAADAGVSLFSILQRDHSNPPDPSWSRKRALEGYDAGAHDAEVGITQQRDLGGAGHGLVLAYDFRPKYEWEFVRCEAYAAGVLSVIKLPRSGGYGFWKLLARLYEKKLISIVMQSWLWDGIYWEPPQPASAILPYCSVLQKVNAGREGKNQFGTETDPNSYTCYDDLYRDQNLLWVPS